MKKTLSAVSAACIAGLLLAACGSGATSGRMAAAADEDTCGWDGSAAAAIAAADTAMDGTDFGDQITANFGESATAGDARISEIKFGVAPGTAQPPTQPTSLSDVEAIYNIPIFPDGVPTPKPTVFASAHIMMTGACANSFAFVPQMWLETFGVDAPTLETQQAVDAGINYLKENEGEEIANTVRIQDMLLYKRFEPGFPLTWFMRGNVQGKNFILQIDQNGTVTPK